MGPPRQLPIRAEPPPPDHWLVLRGGPRHLLETRAALHRARKQFGLLVVSVIVTDPAHLSWALKRLPLARFTVVDYCDVFDLRSQGFSLLPTFQRPHFSVEIMNADDLTIDRLLATLAQTMENPYADH
ncbi:MAG: hypothetical protein ACO3CG_05325 [Ilumatobacteraceae bacterium]